MATKFEQLGFEVEGPESRTLITSADIELLRQSRSNARYADITPEQREAYRRINSALDELGKATLDALSGHDYQMKSYIRVPFKKWRKGSNSKRLMVRHFSPGKSKQVCRKSPALHDCLQPRR